MSVNIEKKKNNKTYWILDCQFASTCVVEVIIKLSTSSKVFLCSAEVIIENVLPSHANISVRSDDLLLFVF